MPEVHNTEDILSGATGIVGIFPSPYSQCAIFQLKRLVYRLIDFFFLIIMFLVRKITMNRKLVLLLTPKKSCLKVHVSFFKIRILQSRSATANDSFPLLAWLCVHVSAAGELELTSALGQRKEKKVKGWRRMINPVSGDILHWFRAFPEEFW